MSLIQKAKIILFPGGKNILKLIYYSSIIDKLRRFFHNKLIKIKYTNKAIERSEGFLKLHLGCGDRSLPGYINIDYRKTKAVDYVCDASKLPFPDGSVETIETYHMLEHLPRSVVNKALMNWWKKLIPGGELIIECPDFDGQVNEYIKGNEEIINNIFGLQRHKSDFHYWGYNFNRLKTLLKEKGFTNVKKYSPKDYHRLEEPCIRVRAFKSINSKNFKVRQKFKKFKINNRFFSRLQKQESEIEKNKIFNDYEVGVLNCKRVLVLSGGFLELETLKKLNKSCIVIVNITEKNDKIDRWTKKNNEIARIQYIYASIENLPFKNRVFCCGFAIKYLEYIDTEKVNKAVKEIKRILKFDAKFTLYAPNKALYNNERHKQVFHKGNLVRLFDECNFPIDSIDLNESENDTPNIEILKIRLSNKDSYPFYKNRRICGIGGYELYRYTQLGFHWDGQARAFNSLGFETLLLDIRKDNNYGNLREKIVQFNPDILWIGLESGLSLLKWMKQDIRILHDKGCKVIYWFCDLRNPKVIDLSQLVDVMFISNFEQINEYKKKYSLDKIYYMPQACSPAFMHKTKIKELYDLCFAGSLNGSLHHNRAKTIKKISNKYNIVIKNNIRNNISNFYSKSKLAIGMNADLNKYLYTSNRFFVALGCGAFYLCEYFPGIEKLVQNHKHLVWYRTQKELFKLVDHYLGSKSRRDYIRNNAQQLAHSKHTYAHRITNMLDIIDGKTEDFYGFI